MSADQATTGTDEAPADDAPTDDLRSGLLAALERELGDGVVATHLVPGVDLWVRVHRDAWHAAGLAARDVLGCAFFNFLSAIDWLPSPYGRYENAEVDHEQATPASGRDATIVPGYTGGDTRLQVFARVVNIERHIGFTLKADVPDDDASIASWSTLYHGADWHERETWEMYGITFTGHPNLSHIYLPTGFEGFPLRKDYPLLARIVKPWPGIVDVEPMPGEPAEADGEGEAGEEET